MSAFRQSTCVVIGGRAVLIEGPQGSGKSSLALALIDRGAVLVGDDSIVLEARSGGLFASPHPQTRGLLEIRNIGLVEMPVCEEAPVALLIRLDPLAPRFVEQARNCEVEGVRLPAIDLWPDSPVLALRSEMALAQYGLATR